MDCELKGFYCDCQQDKYLCPDCYEDEDGHRSLYLSPDSYKEV